MGYIKARTCAHNFPFKTVMFEIIERFAQATIFHDVTQFFRFLRLYVLTGFPISRHFRRVCGGTNLKAFLYISYLELIIALFLISVIRFTKISRSQETTTINRTVFRKVN